MNDKHRGLYNKFHVSRLDGSSVHPGKHEDCDYFVLDLTHDKFAKAALLAYAEACKSEYPQLAHDLRAAYEAPCAMPAIRRASPPPSRPPARFAAKGFTGKRYRK